MPITAPDGRSVRGNPAACIDHTLLKAETTERQIQKLCEEAVEYGFAAVCVPPCHVRFSATTLYGTGVAVASVAGFPLGYAETASKQHEAAQAVNAGAREIDMVINQGWAATGDFARVEEEIRAVVRAVSGTCVKVIIECCNLGREAKSRLVEVVVAAGARYVKTSTGFAASGATVEDVRLLAAVADGRVGVKAAGGIRSLEDCRAMLAAGATRIGSSSGVAIVEQWLRTEGLS